MLAIFTMAQRYEFYFGFGRVRQLADRAFGTRFLFVL